MSRILIGVALLLLSLSAVLGVLNATKTQSLRTEVVRTEADRAKIAQDLAAKEKELKEKAAAIAEAKARAGENESRVGAAEADLIRTQTERAELTAKLQANEREISELRERLEEAVVNQAMPGELPMPGSGDLQTQLEETRRQLDAAEREKQLLTDRVRVVEERTAEAEAPKKRRAVNLGIRGTVLAVNQAYNFVVLNLGGRQGVEPNSEMLVLRGGSAIGKIRISSVEPATAIGDILTSTIRRGVQVQPGDTVIYAGPNS